MNEYFEKAIAIIAWSVVIVALLATAGWLLAPMIEQLLCALAFIAGMLLVYGFFYALALPFKEA